MGLRDNFSKKTKYWAKHQTDHFLFQKPKFYFATKFALLAGIIIQRILILTNVDLNSEFTFDILQLVGMPVLFGLECLLFKIVQKYNRLRPFSDLLFGVFQIIVFEFTISLSIPTSKKSDGDLLIILHQEVLLICIHTIMFINSFLVRSGLLTYACITFIFRLSPTLSATYYSGWSVMMLSLIASFFIILFSKDKTLVIQTKPKEDFSKLENIPHGLAILTRDKEVIFMNGVFKGILHLTDERDALQKILKMKRLEAYSEETKQLLLKEIQIRMSNETIKAKSPKNEEKVVDINEFPTAGSLGKKHIGDTPAIYIKKPQSGKNSPVNQYNKKQSLAGSPATPEKFSFLVNNTRNTHGNDDSEAANVTNLFPLKPCLKTSKIPLTSTKLHHLTSLQVHIETEKDSQNTVEYSINSLFSSLLDEAAPDRIRRKVSLAQVAKNVVNGLFIRRASQHFNKNAGYNTFDLTNTKTQRVQAVNRNSKGELRILEITLTPMWSGEKEALFVYLNDITSEVKAKDLQEISQHKDRLLKFVSHEFRTPLNCLVISLNTLKPLVSRELYSDYLAPALNSTLMLLSLVNDILDYSQMQARKLKIAIAPSNLRNILDEVISMMEMPAQAKNLEIKLDWDPLISKTFFTDGNRLKQILINLISNALKFTIQGCITIKGTYVTKSMCKIEVIDTGVGISKDNLDNLFKEFGKIQENVHMNPQGVGLGLVISKLLSQELGSDRIGLQVKSEVGVGTTFYFFLTSRRQEEAGFEHTDLGSSDDDQEPQIFAPKLSEPHSRKLILQKRSNSYKKHERLTLSKAKTSTGNKSVQQKQAWENVQPYTLNFKHEYSKSSLSNVTPIVSVMPQVQGWTMFRMKRQYMSSRQRCLSTGFCDNMSLEKSYSEQISLIFQRLNRSCKCAKILLVDDNTFNVTALKLLLKSFGVESVGVVSGDAAIKEVLRNEGHSECCKNYVIIFMDIEMPIMNGFDTAKELRRLMSSKEISYIPIVGITGHSPQEKRVECLLSGMNDMVCKPVTSQIMQELICKWIIPE